MSRFHTKKLIVTAEIQPMSRFHEQLSHKKLIVTAEMQTNEQISYQKVICG